MQEPFPNPNSIDKLLYACTTYTTDTCTTTTTITTTHTTYNNNFNYNNNNNNNNNENYICINNDQSLEVMLFCKG